MLSPQDIENTSFTKAIRGYDTAEVDEYVAVMLENYTQLFNVCEDYEKKLRAVARHLKTIRENEEANQTAAMTAQQISDGIIDKANAQAEQIIKDATAKARDMIAVTQKKCDDRLASVNASTEELITASQEKSDALLFSAKVRCARVLSDFKAELNEKKAELDIAKKSIEEFKNTLLLTYKAHIDSIKTMIPVIDIEIDADYEAQLTDEVLDGIKEDAVEIARTHRGGEVPEYDELTLDSEYLKQLDQLELNSVGTDVVEDMYDDEDEYDDTNDAIVQDEADENIVDEYGNEDDGEYDEDDDSIDYEDDEEEEEMIIYSSADDDSIEADDTPVRDVSVDGSGNMFISTEDDEEYSDEDYDDETEYEGESDAVEDEYSSVGRDIETEEIELMDEEPAQKRRRNIFELLRGRKSKVALEDDISDTDANIDSESNIFEGFDK